MELPPEIRRTVVNARPVRYWVPAPHASTGELPGQIHELWWVAEYEGTTHMLFRAQALDLTDPQLEARIQVALLQQLGREG